MNAITIQTISDRAITRIEEVAAIHKRTVEEEAADLLEKAVGERQTTPLALLPLIASPR